jgi:hypothetical protein
VVAILWDVAHMHLLHDFFTADFLPWRCERYVPSKRRFTYGLYGAISQEMEVLYLFDVYISPLYQRVCNVAGNERLNSELGGISQWSNLMSLHSRRGVEEATSLLCRPRFELEAAVMQISIHVYGPNLIGAVHKREFENEY